MNPGYFADPMRFIWQHIRVILEQYNGGLPLSHFLRNYFRLHPKLGSRDRRILSEMSYCWFRCQKGLPAGLSFEEKIAASLFLCGPAAPQLQQFMPGGWQGRDSGTLTERLEFLAGQGIVFNPEQLLSFEPELSAGIGRQDWLISMLRQPQLFIRVRKRMAQVKGMLQEHEIRFSDFGTGCLALPNGTAVEKILDPKDYVVQDASSQATGRFLQPKVSEVWWDCCSGAGGKSLLLKDQEPAVQLTVSDKRHTILQNLAERFRLYGHARPETLVLDLTDAAAVERALGTEVRFDNIICDVPCSGSGTWARTPEQLYFFEESRLGPYPELQRTIAAHALSFLRPGGRFIYITCSVFRAENEAVVESLLAGGLAKLAGMELINGLQLGADCMFVAVLQT